MQGKSNILVIIVLSVIFGLVSGVVGSIYTKSYLMNGVYNIPFFGEIDFSDKITSGPGLIIRDAKKVVVEQNSKVEETINSINNKLVGIFKKISLPVEANNQPAQPHRLKVDDYYNIANEQALGSIITSDGWIIAKNFNASLTEEELAEDFVIISKDGHVYDIDKAVDDQASLFLFIHVKEVRDWPVIEFADDSEIISGQIVIALNWEDRAVVSSIIGFKDTEARVKSSDIFSDRLIISDQLSSDFDNSVLFNLSGKIIGLNGADNEIEQVGHFKTLVKSLLMNETIKRASLGVNYINLSSLVNPDNTETLRGALIAKDANGLAFSKLSPAKAAGLIVGDIITYVNNIEINKDNNLTYVIQSFIAGDKVSIRFVRDGKEGVVEVQL